VGTPGLLVLGPGEEAGTVVALWGDSWHQAPSPKWLTGVIDDQVITVGYSYADEWEWTISVDATDSDSLRLRMNNVVPLSAVADDQSAGAYWAMQANLARSP
jgi:hypothetical protein